MKRSALTAFLALALAAPAAAQDKPPVPGEDQALEVLKRSIAFRTVAGAGNQTFDYATYLKSVLVAGGFAPEDVTIEKVDDTAWLAARYRGTGKAKNGAKPILISAHMDVVEAKPSDWERDPFTAIVEKGFVWGRGSSDNKADLSIMVATLIQLKAKGFKPGRDIVLLLSGDEETSMKTTAALAEKYRQAELLLNIDGGGGKYSEDGKPETFGLQGAEKTYADFELGFTDPGGHSSAPDATNPIYMLARVLERIGAYQFPGQLNEITRASLLAAADQTPGAKGDAMHRFVANPEDKQALAVLRADPAYVGQTGTTCVATMVSAGHAPNALPQTATANVNCRIFPGVKVADVQAKLAEVAGDPGMTIREVGSGSVASDASPLRPDLMKVVTKAIHARFPGIPVVPSMSAGATDSMHFRARGVPSYGVSPGFMKTSDSFAHGKNERTPLSEIGPSILFFETVLKELAK